MQMALHTAVSEPLHPAETDALAHAVPLRHEPADWQRSSPGFSLAWLLTTKLEPALAYYVYVRWYFRNQPAQLVQHWKRLPRRLRRRAELLFDRQPQVRALVRASLPVEEPLDR